MEQLDFRRLLELQIDLPGEEFFVDHINQRGLVTITAEIRGIR